MIDFTVCFSGFALGLFVCSVSSLISFVVSFLVSLMLGR